MQLKPISAAFSEMVMVGVLIAPATAQETQDVVSSTPNELSSEQVRECDHTKSPDDERELLGLGESVSEDMTEIRFGLVMSNDDAKRIDRLEQVRYQLDYEELRKSFSESLGEGFVSVTWSYVNGVEVRVSERVSSEMLESALTKAGLERDFVPIQVGGAVSHDRRSEILDSLASQETISVLDELGVVAVEPDEFCGTITLLVDPKSGDEQVGDALSARLPNISSDVQLRVATEADIGEDAVGRGQLQTTQSGGLRYKSGGGSCTSAAPWYDRVSTPWGTYTVTYAITAGHCVPQSDWSSTPSSWGGTWWTTVTSNNNLRQPYTTIATGQARIRYGAELDVAVWPLSSTYSSGSPRSATNSDAHSYNWHNLGWWQWSPTWNTGTSGGDAVGDWVCQSGYTTSFRAPDPAWNTNIIECGSITTRDLQFSRGGSWFYRIRVSNMDSCTGDSGGTVWRAGWYSGILKGNRGTQLPSVNGNTCRSQTEYSHVGYVKPAFGLVAPVGFS